MHESHAWLTSPDELFCFNTWLLLMKIQFNFPKVIPKRCLMLTLCRNCEWILNLNGIETSFKKFAQQMLLAKISREFKNSRISKKLFCLKGGCYLPLISYPWLLFPSTWNWGWIRMNVSLALESLCKHKKRSALSIKNFEDCIIC